MANSFINAQKTHKERKIQIACVILNILALVYLCGRGSYYIAMHPDTPAFMALLMSTETLVEEPFAVLFDKQFVSLFGISSILAGFIAWCAYDHMVLNKHYTDGEQCGTAKWQTVPSIKQYNRKFTAPYGKPIADGAENTIYSKHCQMSMNTRQTGLNNNAMVIGGPGSGKSYNIVRPNLLQKYGSYVITDPSGELLATTGKFFEENDYDVRVFNLTDMAHSHCYNPFNYLSGEEDVLTLIECLIKNTEGQNKNGGDPFWEKAETALLEAIIFYLIRHQGKDKQNFSMVSKLLRQAKADPKTAKSKLDSIFDEVRQYDDNDICLKQYDIFKQASEKTAQSILITAAVRLAPFNIDAVENLTSSDDMDLKSIGDKPTVTFIIVPQGNNPYAFLVNMLYSQMFDTLYYHAAMDCEGLHLKYDVRFILDEFANVGIIPGFQVKLTTMRKYGLSCMIFIQAVGQIKNLYKDDWETLMGACDTLVYLGGNELSSMEDLSKKLGDQTIRTRDSSRSHSGKGGSDSRSFKYQKRSLLTVDEIRRLKDGYCIIVIKGQDPFYDAKYKTPEHPNAKYLGDLGKGLRLYTFDYCNTKPESTDKLERKRQLIQKDKLNRAAQSRRPDDKVYRSNTPMPSPKPITPEDELVLAKKVAEQTTIMSFDKKEAVIGGATIKEVRNGIMTVTSAKPKPTVASASKQVTKSVLQPKMTIPIDSILDEFNNL